MRWSLIALLLTLIGTSSISPTQAEGTSSRITLIDANGVYETSRILGVRTTPQGNSALICERMGEGLCDPRTTPEIFASLVLPRCDEQTNFCVSGVKIYESAETPAVATYLGELKESEVVAQPEFGLPRGGGALLYAPDASSSLASAGPFVVRVMEELVYAGRREWSHRKFNISVTLDPVRFPGDESLDLPVGTRASISVRLPAASGGWFSGRIKSPEITIKRVNSAVNELTIDAESALVQRLSVAVPDDKHTSLMREFNMPPNSGHAIESGFDLSTRWIEELRSFVNDRATSQSNVWVVRSSPIQGQDDCFPDDRLSGFVATNATAYSWNPPKLVNGFLDYAVGGLHFTVDGSLTQGTYDLVLSSETARCLYGFTDAPVSATISVVNSAGEQQSVSAVVLSEKDGWLRLGAYGFSFSNPTIRVQLQQAKPAPSAKPTTKTPVKKTIVCKRVKTNQVRKVTAIKPACPTGWKRV